MINTFKVKRQYKKYQKSLEFIQDGIKDHLTNKFKHPRLSKIN